MYFLEHPSLESHADKGSRCQRIEIDTYIDLAEMRTYITHDTLSLYNVILCYRIYDDTGILFLELSFSLELGYMII